MLFGNQGRQSPAYAVRGMSLVDAGQMPVVPGNQPQLPEPAQAMRPRPALGMFGRSAGVLPAPPVFAGDEPIRRPSRLEQVGQSTGTDGSGGRMGLPQLPGGGPSPSGLLGDPRAFDYDAALKRLLPPEDKPSQFQKIMRVAAPILMSLAGNQAGAHAFVQQQAARRQDRERRTADATKTILDWQHQDWARNNGAYLDSSKPFSSGRDRVAYDPISGEAKVVYDGQEDFENYATELGLEPGSQAYFDAVEDYVLRANGPSAFERDLAVDDHRTGNRVRLEGVRQNNRQSLEATRQTNRVRTRQTPTYRDTHPTPSVGPKKVTATGPNGDKVEWNGKAWVPVG